ncbi:extracellular solute-binding protein family 1 [Pyrolobus fumarii 1A]|uniref:Extracellular solute-binding protein family 1 n=1 Tax=Pyrolobus fumarii (strain DSM 11204 / 1A) TaxID=694429 RepID=G0EEA1_PYRF1|nr:extracellular solute-binding protein [Pyrolobus fumarii]AEM38795.1 extracellular solute-binding protein family 1 [Pyrolobus fumarii 1A]
MRPLSLVLIAVLVAAAFTAGYFLVINTHEGVRLRVATTTSLYATGLLDYLADEFHKLHPDVRVEYIAVGSGEALRKAAQGDACMVFVHAPSLEKKYIERGILENHHIIAYNYFVIVGPSNDPAGVREASDAIDAFRRIYKAGIEGKAVFVSRGDNSGTHVRERMLWRMAGLDPQPGRDKWYIESGTGMARTLIIAEELGAYTLSDTGTFLKLKLDGKLPHLEILYSNSTELINVYSVYLVSTCTGAERKAALEFLKFVVEHQELIGRYGLDKYGKPLFYPARGHEDMLEKAWQMLAEGG